jgi:VanZ family protein
MWDNDVSGSPRAWRPWLPAAVWALTLAVLSSIPGSAIPEVPLANTDKLVHVGLYFVLGLLVARALGATTTLAPARTVAAAVLLVAAFGVTDELHQLLTPNRSCDWHDLVADALGGLLGAFAWTRIAPRRAGSQGGSRRKPDQP